MPSFCNYMNCHNLASSSYQGYCNQNHFERATERKVLLHVLKENPQLSTMKEAKEYILSTITSSSRYAAYRALLRE
jgi:hypothetical protein